MCKQYNRDAGACQETTPGLARTSRGCPTERRLPVLGSFIPTCWNSARMGLNH